MLAALGARNHKWHGFNNNWGKLLKSEGVAFSHIVAMENKEHPFEDWGPGRTRPFVRRARRRIEKNCEFGVTVAMDMELHRQEFRNRLPPKVPKDSAYGTCVRLLIEGVVFDMIAYIGEGAVANFVFEESNHYGEAERVFFDYKAHVPEMAPYLGMIAKAAKAEFGGLQAADLVASLGRRFETSTEFLELTPVQIQKEVERKGERQSCPVRHVDVNELVLPHVLTQATNISLQKRIAKRAKGRARNLANRRARIVEFPDN